MGRASSSRLILAFVFLLPLGLVAQTVPSPESFFGFRPGEDRRLLNHETLVAYYRAVADASDRVTVRTLGRTTEDRELIALEITTRPRESREPVQKTQRRVAHGRLGADIGRALTSQPVVVYIQGTLHSTEIAASMTFPPLVYKLATADDPETRRMLANLWIVLVPSANPDGLDRVVDWYRGTLDTPHEGTSPPDLYHRYAGHDDNRDWFMLSLKETQILSKLLYREWLPQIVLDIHQMGSTRSRMFVPPYSDPLNPNLDPLLVRQIDWMGSAMALELSRHRLKGVAQRVTFDNWWHGGARSVPARHNMIGILTETASARLATPLWIAPDQLRGHGPGMPEYRARGIFPDPWPGGWWRMSDAMEYQEVSTMALLRTASDHRERLVSDFHELALRAIAKGERSAPHAFFLDATPADALAQQRLLMNLQRTGVQLHRATAAFTHGGRSWPEGTWIVRMDQAFRAHAKDLLEPQRYPELRMRRDGPVIRPYDASGWTLPFQFGLSASPAETPLDPEIPLREVVALEPLASTFPDEGGQGLLALAPKANSAYTLVNRALRAGLSVYETTLPSRAIFLFDESDREQLAELGQGLGLELSKWDGPNYKRRLRKPRVALLQHYPPSMDAGWTRLVLEEHGFDPTIIRPPDLRQDELAERFDALIIPDIAEKNLEEGPSPTRLPPSYRGGLGPRGAAAIRDFVDRGGQLLAFQRAIDWVSPALALGIRRQKPGDDAAQPVVCPGSLLRVRRDPETALAMVPQSLTGFLPEEIIIYQNRGEVLVLPPQDPSPDRRGQHLVVLRYTAGDPLVSGYLTGGDQLSGRPVMVTSSRGKGRVVLYAFRPQHRSQTLGTFRLIFSALYGRQ